MKKITVYKDQAGEWRWRKVSGTNIVADSGEGYEKMASAVEMAKKEGGEEFEIVIEGRPDHPESVA